MPAAVSTATAFSFQPSSFEIARVNFEKASAHLRLSSELHMLLSTPHCEVRIEIPVWTEDGSRSSRNTHTPRRLGALAPRPFVGHRVQHNGMRGACLGGMEFSSDFDHDTARALAEQMTWKAALLDLPFGGASGGVACHPERLSDHELEELGRSFVARTHNLFGPFCDVLAPGPEVPLQLRRALYDELSRKHGFMPATMTGKPLENGGVVSPATAVGRGLATLVQKVAQDTSLGASPLRFSIVGHNEVTVALAFSLQQSGAQLVAATNGDDNCASVALQIAADYALASECDVLILCDRSIAIHPENARKIKACLVFEAADLAISPSADVLLQSAGVTVIPDLIANAGAAVCAYVEWSLSLQELPWLKPNLAEQIERAMLRAYRTARDYAASHYLSLRTAAYSVGIDRVACLEKLRAA